MLLELIAALCTSLFAGAAIYINLVVSALGAWAQGRGIPVLVGGLLLGSVVPFTLIVIFPTNRALCDPNLDESSSKAAALLAKWNRLHAARSGAALLALVFFLLHLGGIL